MCSLLLLLFTSASLPLLNVVYVHGNTVIFVPGTYVITRVCLPVYGLSQKRPKAKEELIAYDCYFVFKVR